MGPNIAAMLFSVIFGSLTVGVINGIVIGTVALIEDRYPLRWTVGTTLIWWVLALGGFNVVLAILVAQLIAFAGMLTLNLVFNRVA